MIIVVNNHSVHSFSRSYRLLKERKKENKTKTKNKNHKHSHSDNNTTTNNNNTNWDMNTENFWMHTQCCISKYWYESYALFSFSVCSFICSPFALSQPLLSIRNTIEAFTQIISNDYDVRDKILDFCALPHEQTHSTFVKRPNLFNGLKDVCARARVKLYNVLCQVCSFDVWFGCK